MRSIRSPPDRIPSRRRRSADRGGRCLARDQHRPLARARVRSRARGQGPRAGDARPSSRRARSSSTSPTSSCRSSSRPTDPQYFELWLDGETLLERSNSFEIEQAAIHEPPCRRSTDLAVGAAIRRCPICPTAGQADSFASTSSLRSRTQDDGQAAGDEVPAEARTDSSTPPRFAQVHGFTPRPSSWLASARRSTRESARLRWSLRRLHRTASGYSGRADRPRPQARPPSPRQTRPRGPQPGGRVARPTC